jgi:hypothetical protein
VLLVAGFASGSTRGTLMIAVGIGLAALGGLELAVREHFAGYRSHSGLLALACGVAAGAAVGGIVALLFGSILAVVPVVVGVLVFVPALLVFRNAFRRASGGLTFRIGRLHG